MTFELPKLPYDLDALEPHCSKRTMEFHYGKHHKSYIEKLNEAVDGTKLADKPLAEIVRATAADTAQQDVFNNAAQSWNHDFFWKCMVPKGGGEPEGALAARIKRDFGSFDKFKDAFAKTAKKRFGSGWAWLVVDAGRLSVISTPNADTPIAHHQVPIITLDVWEHAYYLDHQNKRPDFIKAFLKHLVNWRFAAENFEKTELAKKAA